MSLFSSRIQLGAVMVMMMVMMIFAFIFVIITIISVDVLKLCQQPTILRLHIKELNVTDLYRNRKNQRQNYGASSPEMHTKSHTVSLLLRCHLAQVYARLDPSQTGWYSIYLPRRDGKLS